MEENRVSLIWLREKNPTYTVYTLTKNNDDMLISLCRFNSQPSILEVWILAITQWMGMNHCFYRSYNVYETTMFSLMYSIFVFQYLIYFFHSLQMRPFIREQACWQICMLRRCIRKNNGNRRNRFNSYHYRQQNS